MKKIVLSLLFWGLFKSTYAQEISCSVKINADQISSQQLTDRQIFGDMEATIAGFLNTRRWTNDDFSPQERIKCNLVVNLISSPSQNIFKGNAQFQVTRPVYGTTYETIVLNYVDRSFDFSYTPEDRQMIFSENAFSNNLTSILGFYAFMALGVDYDSFSRLGGASFYQKAFQIATLAQNSGQAAWRQGDDQRNRYWLIENTLNQQFASLREMTYVYHRRGLDLITTQPAAARRQALEFIAQLKQVQTQRPNTALVNALLEAKNQEFQQVLTAASLEDRNKAFITLSQIDPARTESYRKMIK